MDKKIKEIVFEILDDLEPGTEFRANDIVRRTRRRTFWVGRIPMDATVTRYMRHYSQRIRPLQRVGNKADSLYRVGEAV
jgi:hypothetical protein